MTDSREAINEVILSILRSHFPSVRESWLEPQALRIGLACETDEIAEFTEQWHEKMLQDMQKLKSFVAHIEAATLEIANLSIASKCWLGQSLVADKHDRVDREALLRAVGDLSKRLNSTTKNAEDTASYIDRRGEWRARGRGRPRNDTAAMVAWMAGLSYLDLTGERPTIINDPLTNEARGPFVALVRDLFSALDIKASVQANAKRAVFAIREKKHVVHGGYSPLPLL